MGRFALIAVLLLPFVEIATFIKMGQAFGVFPTLLGVVISAGLGLLLIRAQGFALAGQLRGTLAQGQLPGRTLADAMFVFVAGVLLLVPGYFTDLMAVILLIQPLRDWIYRFLSQRMRVVSATPPAGRPGGEPYRPRMEHKGTIDLDSDEFRPR